MFFFFDYLWNFLFLFLLLGLVLLFDYYISSVNLVPFRLALSCDSLDGHDEEIEEVCTRSQYDHSHQSSPAVVVKRVC